jgi:hypothetical protein
MRLSWCVSAALVSCLSAWLLGTTGAQDKGKDKGQPAAQKPTLTPAPGEQKKAVAVALKCATPGAVIRYTLDGSTPTADSGSVYTDPISLDRTTTITAVAFAKELAPSQPMTGTYLFAPRQGLATFHIGNSLTNTTAKFADFVRTAGTVHQYQSFTAGGALTWQLWDVQLPKRQKEWDAKLAGYKRIDHFTVQPRDFTKNGVDHEADYAIRFFEVVRKHSPEVQPWFYAEWVEKNRGRPTDQGKIPSRQMKQTYPARTWEESMAAMLLYNEDLQAKVLETYKEGKRPRVLPSCLAMGWIKNMIDRGQLPGAAKDSFYPLLFSDGVHPNVKGGYLVDLTWYAAFYRESPEGKVLPAGTGLTLEQARVMQKLAWEVVKNYPDCGLYEEGTVPVAAPEFVSDNRPAGTPQAVTLTSKTPGAWFRYTLDGTVPTRTRGYVYCGVVTVPAGVTLKAIAYRSGMADSAVAEMRMGAGKGE